MRIPIDSGRKIAAPHHPKMRKSMPECICGPSAVAKLQVPTNAEGKPTMTESKIASSFPSGLRSAERNAKPPSTDQPQFGQRFEEGDMDAPHCGHLSSTILIPSSIILAFSKAAYVENKNQEEDEHQKTKDRSNAGQLLTSGKAGIQTTPGHRSRANCAKHRYRQCP